jgi:predicted DNA-binding mobile mystery protein A
MNKKSLQLQQLGRKMRTFPNEQDSAMPPSGWINAIRTALGMSLQQLGDKMSITKQSVQNIEKREKDGSVTIKSLREVAKSNGYAFSIWLCTC